MVMISERLPHVTSLLVARHGQITFERYFGVQMNEPQDTQSYGFRLNSYQ